jgi:hypothetical protein
VNNHFSRRPGRPRIPVGFAEVAPTPPKALIDKNPATWDAGARGGATQWRECNMRDPLKCSAGRFIE